MANILRKNLNLPYCIIHQYCALERNVINAASLGRTFASKDSSNPDGDADPGPVKFTTSRANAISAQAHREAASRDDSPWSQTISLSISLAAFLIYFGCLREENDIDAMMYDPLEKKIPGFEEAQKKLATSRGREIARQSVV